MKRTLVFLCLATLVFACGDSGGDQTASNDKGGDQTENNDVPDDPDIEVSYNFANGPQGWEGGYTDYPEGSEEDVDFFSSPMYLPEDNFLDHGDHGVDTEERAFRLMAENISRDIFVYIKRRLGEDDGVKPDTEYRVDYEITWASQDCHDEDEELAYFKWGASKWEPLPRPDESGNHIELNVMKGSTPDTGGREARIAGDTRHQLECQQAFDQFVPRQRSRTHTHAIESSPDGDIWLLVGFDSEIPNHNEIYIMRIDAVLTAVECDEGDEQCEIDDAEET